MENIYKKLHVFFPLKLTMSWILGMLRIREVIGYGL
jgi:hypothetical protein